MAEEESTVNACSMDCDTRQENATSNEAALSENQITDEEEIVSPKEQQSVEEKEADTSDKAKSAAEMVNFRVCWNKKNYDVTFDLDKSVDKLKEHIEELTGLLKDGTKTLRDVKITKGTKMMVVGSTINDVLKVTPPSPSQLKEEKTTASAAKEPFCKQKMHKKVLDKGKPDDVMPGIKNRKESLPTVPLSGMYNKYGGKVRLTFKLELDQLWLGTKERTEKLPMGSIKNIVSEPIEEHDDYHILALQLGPTEASRYWIYWVPAQYVDAIKDTVLGKWQPF
ncbi:ubiquitin domain-containing protein UBFD1 isoform X2 [Nematostella vectensis]|uniref:ubiquitin domain-containing protein UBFD1 isoform X2 n=1 Tax=Nematostella vectensis TaxID=45351 RepID=UPI00138FF3E3|nr:ubiquitin domain-containing protein UBFD1 isoform X2 [Nematostella vectensis]